MRKRGRPEVTGIYHTNRELKKRVIAANLLFPHMGQQTIADLTGVSIGSVNKILRGM